MTSDTYIEIKDNLINRILLILGIVAIPVIVVSLLRIITIGWRPFFIVHILIVPLLICFAVFRKTISLSIKGIFLILVFSLVSIFGFKNFALSGSGVPFLMLGILAAVTFLSRKAAILFYVFGVLLFFVFGFLFLQGALSPTIDLSLYHSHFSSWAAALVTFSIVACLVIMLIANIGNLLNFKLHELEKTNAELRTALKEIRTLQGILPICSQCKKIRDDKGYWEQLEHYIGNHSEAVFSHSLCPDCIKLLYPEFEPTTKTP